MKLRDYDPRTAELRTDIAVEKTETVTRIRVPRNIDDLVEKRPRRGLARWWDAVAGSSRAA